MILFPRANIPQGFNKYQQLPIDKIMKIGRYCQSEKFYRPFFFGALKINSGSIKNKQMKENEKKTVAIKTLLDSEKCLFSTFLCTIKKKARQKLDLAKVVKFRLVLGENSMNLCEIQFCTSFVRETISTS